MAEDEPHLDVVRFRAGGFDVAVEARLVLAMRTSAQPGARPIEELLGLPGGNGARRWLLVRSDSEECCVEVGEPVRLDSIPATAIHPLPALALARQQLRGVKALALTGDGLALLVDLGPGTS